MDTKKLKVALIHEYLVQHGGAERVLEALIELFPQADIYTGLYNKDTMSETINQQHIYSMENKFLLKVQKQITLFMPIYFESFDLRNYDLIISDGQAWPKGVLTNTKQLHISYIHTPPRFLYGYSVESGSKRNKWYFKPLLAVVDFFLRIWDFYAAQKPDFLLAPSEEVKKRIMRFYKREAQVIHPPVETSYQLDEILQQQIGNNYFLAVSRLAAYKNIDLLIETFKMLPELNLKIIGTGAEEHKLKELSANAPNIELLGRQSEIVKHTYLENCLGLINCVDDEDFGIVPVEAMAHGKPVLAHFSGGHKETVKDGVSGMFFNTLEKNALKDKVQVFLKNIKDNVYNAEEIKEYAARFDAANFKANILQFIQEKQAVRESV